MKDDTKGKSCNTTQSARYAVRKRAAEAFRFLYPVTWKAIWDEELGCRGITERPREYHEFGDQVRGSNFE